MVPEVPLSGAKVLPLGKYSTATLQAHQGSVCHAGAATLRSGRPRAEPWTATPQLWGMPRVRGLTMSEASRAVLEPPRKVIEAPAGVQIAPVDITQRPQPWTRASPQVAGSQRGTVRPVP
jgi:hypothetical protein